jgi:hypothetical protein
MLECDDCFQGFPVWLKLERGPLALLMRIGGDPNDPRIGCGILTAVPAGCQFR